MRIIVGEYHNNIYNIIALWSWTLKGWDQLVWEFIIRLIPQSQKFRQTKSNSNFKYVHINKILHFVL